VGWSGSSKSRNTRFHAEDAVTRDWYRSVLSHLGYDARDTGRRLELTQADSKALFESLGPPVPGVRHKWAFEKPAYDEIRRKQWIEQMDIADGPFREGMLGRRPRAWDYKYRERDVLVTLLDVSDGDEMKVTEYLTYRQTVDYDLPSQSWFLSHGGMSTWFELAGVKRQATYDFSEMIEAITYVADTIGSWPTIEEYQSHRRPDDPAIQWFYQNRPDGIESWSDLIGRAKHVRE
jgi:hypothetical protein